MLRQATVPIVGVRFTPSGSIISASQDARAEADHLTLTTLHAINVQQLEMLEQQKEMLQQQREILDLIQKKRLAETP